MNTLHWVLTTFFVESIDVEKGEDDVEDEAVGFDEDVSADKEDVADVILIDGVLDGRRRDDFKVWTEGVAVSTTAVVVD